MSIVALTEGLNEDREVAHPRLRLALETDREIGVAIRVLNLIELMGCQLIHASMDEHNKGYWLQLELTPPSDKQIDTLIARIASYQGVCKLELQSGSFA